MNLITIYAITVLGCFLCSLIVTYVMCHDIKKNGYKRKKKTTNIGVKIKAKTILLFWLFCPVLNVIFVLIIFFNADDIYDRIKDEYYCKTSEYII